MKKLFFYLLCVFIFLSIIAKAQNNSVFKVAISANADSTTVRNTVAASQSYYSNIGALYYNRQSSKWRIFSDSTWMDLIQSGSGGSGLINAYNGLTVTANSVKLGGALTENTTLSGAFTLVHTNTLTTFPSGGISIFNPANTFSYNFVAGAIAANRTINIPAITDTKTMAVASTTLTGSRIPINTAATPGDLFGDSGLTFASNTLSAPTISLTPSATLAAVYMGSITADPSTLSDGAMWYRSDTDIFRGRANGASVNFTTGTLTAGRIPYNLSASSLQDDADLTYDGTNMTINGGQTISRTATKVSRQTITLNGLTGTLAANANLNGSFPPLIAFPPNSVIEFDVVVTAVLSTGAQVASIRNSGLYRVDNAGTLTFIAQGTDVIKESTAGIFTSLTFTVLTGNPGVNVLRGAAVGNYAIGAIGTFNITSL